MNFDEKDSMLFDDEEKKSIGLPFIIIAVILCIIVGAVVVAFKYNGMDFNFKSVNTSRVCVFAFTFGDVIVRIMGIFFLVVSLLVACRKMVLDDNDSSIYWYKIIICMMVGFTFMILGSSIITVFVTLLTDIYR
jgi:hypothetical protein